jgi:hypothetical protein
MGVAKAEVKSSGDGFDGFGMLDGQKPQKMDRQLFRLRTLKRRVALDRSEFMSLFARPPCTLDGCATLTAKMKLAEGVRAAREREGGGVPMRERTEPGAALGAA